MQVLWEDGLMQLNVEQDKLIHAKPSGHMLIKGVAGSGKTTVGIRKGIHLLRNYCIDKRDSVLIVTFNRTLKNYIKYLYK